MLVYFHLVSHSEDEEVENEDLADFLIWREQKISAPWMNGCPNPSTDGIPFGSIPASSSSSSSSMVHKMPMGTKKRSSEDILKRLNALDFASSAASGGSFVAKK